MSNLPQVGWIGLGKMGVPMALNLIKAGFPLIAYNRTAAKAKPLTDQGAKLASSMADAAVADMIVSMIADDPALHEVAAAVLGKARAGSIFIDMSTVSPTASAEVAKLAESKGVSYLRAPVSGSTVVAAAGNLTILASGPQAAFDRAKPLFEAMGKTIFHVGTNEEARYLKLSINMMVGITAAMAGEALALCEGGGMDWKQTIDVINASVVASPLFGYKVAPLKDRNFAPAFTASQMAKDFDLALAAGREHNVPLPVASIVRQFLGAMKGTGKGELDFFAYVTLLEELAGLNKA